MPDQVDVHASDEKEDVSLPHVDHAPGTDRTRSITGPHVGNPETLVTIDLLFRP
ncbi:hypothetical protein WEI85_47555 [Actinomycetes bacterium KLBMP 9797]